MVAEASPGEPGNWWISWYACRADGPFELHTPWWVSGLRIEDVADTIVAAVRAHSDNGACELIYAAYDTRPKALEFRFCEPRPSGWSPFQRAVPASRLDEVGVTQRTPLTMMCPFRPTWRAASREVPAHMTEPTNPDGQADDATEETAAQASSPQPGPVNPPNEPKGPPPPPPQPNDPYMGGGRG